MIPIFASITHNTFSYDIGPIQITGFGLGMLMAFAIGQVVMQRELWRRGFDPEPVADLVFAAVIGGLIGAKLYYAILVGDMSAIFSRAGFVYWGGLIGGIIAVLFVTYRKKLSIPRICDVGGIAVAAAYGVGRTGCWAVGDDYGKPLDAAFAVAFPHGAPPSTVANMMHMFNVSFPAGTNPMEVVAVHPTQLYEVALGIVMFSILWKIRDHKHAEGWLFGAYCVLAGMERFFIEFFRAKDDMFFGPFTAAQVIAILFALAGVAIMYARRNITNGAHGIYATAGARG